jgi:hypothetical protein
VHSLRKKSPKSFQINLAPFYTLSFQATTLSIDPQKAQKSHYSRQELIKRRHRNSPIFVSRQSSSVFAAKPRQVNRNRYKAIGLAFNSFCL